jgi:serine-type D-Ala-D-Ala carboxypeptidase/endopeptidase (penicillin-binding protein 4)
LDRQGLSFPELVIDNGSGLSRLERISAQNLARLLQSIAASPYADLIRESLPTVGQDGTMARRLVNDPIAGHAWIKTGSLNDVRSIAGYVDAASGTRYAVVMLVNGPRAEFSQPAQDALLRWIYSNG